MNKRIPIILGMILTAIALWLLISPAKLMQRFIENLDNLGYDIQLRTYVLTHKQELSPQVAIIDIDDKSIAALGRWPWPRAKIAKLIEKLNEQGVAVIAFDIFFSENEPNIAQSFGERLKIEQKLTSTVADSIQQNLSFFEDDRILAEAISQNQTVLAISFLPRRQTQNILSPPLLTLTPAQAKQLTLRRAEGFISNIPVIQNAARKSGFINIYADADGIVRRAPMIMAYENSIYPALSLQAVQSFLGSKVSLITQNYHNLLTLEGIKVGINNIPTDEKGQVLIPFVGKSFTLPYFSANDVINNKIPTNSLLGKIVFIGTSATGLGDLQPTAIESPFPGVEIQATLASGLLMKNFSYKPAWTYGATLVITLLLGLAAAFSFAFLGPRSLSAIILIVPVAILMLNNMLWEQTGLVISMIVPTALVMVIALLNIIYGYLFETRRREHLKEMFGQYVPEEHIDEMLHTKTNYGLYGDHRDMTVLFADIRNFTSISEGMSATELVEMLNTYFTPMTEIIFKHHGTIDKYVGDLIMAFWGAPMKDKLHARHAIEAAINMRQQMQILSSTLALHQWPELKIGIGINSGMMNVGDMGSKYRRNYTVLGDAVNLASRVEGLTKFYGVDIIVTESTQQDQPYYVFRQLDKVQVKGKNKVISLYELVCERAQLTLELDHELELYAKALNFYFLQKWDNAALLMGTLHQTYPDKKLYKIYLERITQFKEKSPPPDWDGVYIHAVK